MKRPTEAAALRFDIVAGLTAAAVVLPKAMAYATVAGCPSRWASTPPLSRWLSTRSSALPGFSASAARPRWRSSRDAARPRGAGRGSCQARHGDGHADRARRRDASRREAAPPRFRRELHLDAGPDGFKAGIGLVIVLDQVPKLLGVHITKQGFFRDVLSVVRSVRETSVTTLAVAAATAAWCWSAWSGSGRIRRRHSSRSAGNRRVVVRRSSGRRGLDSGFDPAGLPVPHDARTSRWSCSCCRGRSGSP